MHTGGGASASGGGVASGHGQSAGAGPAARVAAVERRLKLVGIHSGRLQRTFVVVGVGATVVEAVRLPVCVELALL